MASDEAKQLDEQDSHFVYGPASFRLLSFDNVLANDEAKIQADATMLSLRLQAFTSQPLPTFTALSYTWGSPKRGSKVLCNGKALAITSNLNKVLKQCRRIARESLDRNPLYFWADGICINQDDVAEKNWAVAGMAAIYRRVGEVLLYIGEPEDASQAGLAIKIVEANVKMRRGPVPEDAVEPIVVDAIPDEDHPVWKAVTHCLNPSTFVRAWVIQEAILAKQLTIRYGDASCPFDLYREFMVTTLEDWGRPRGLDSREDLL